MADELPPPIEIPWRLASTTPPRIAGDPDQTAPYHCSSTSLTTRNC